MVSTVNCYTTPPQSQINLADNLEYLLAGVVTAMPAYFIKRDSHQQNSKEENTRRARSASQPQFTR